MPFGDFSNPTLAILSTFVVGLVSALIPVVNAELFVIFLGTVATRSMLPILVLVVTVAHMAGKAILFLAGRATDRLPAGWLKSKVESARRRVGQHDRVGGALVFTSAVLGIPPFYVITVASGALRLSFIMFMVTGFVGRLIRFTTIAAFPALIRANS